MIYTMKYESPLGKLTIASEGDNIVGLWLEGQKYFAASIKGEMTENPNLPVFADARHWLEDYFAGKKPEISALPLKPEGGTFRKAIWEILCEIPYGELTTYGKIAEKMAVRLGRQSMSSQAVGGAVGHNPISIIIPCHRVVGSNGSLTGYAGGIDKKIQLLQHEGVELKGLYIPKGYLKVDKLQ